MISEKHRFMYVIVLCLFLAGWCPPVLADLTDNLLAYWRLDETQGLIAEDSYGTNDGSLNSGPVWTASPLGGAIFLDGTDDYVLVPAGSGSIFDFGPDLFTLSVWFKTTAGSDQTLLASPGKSPNHGDYYRLDILASGRVRFEYATYDVQTMISPLSYNDGVWHHVAAVRDDVKTGKVYVDGVLVAEDTDNTGGIFTGIQANDNLYIGCYKPANSHFQGTLDEVLVYRRALSSDEVMQLFDTGLAALVSLEILGPDQVAENSSASYKAITHCDDGSSRDVTSSAVWSVAPPGFASIDSSGLLTTADIEKFQNLTLTASYTRQGVTVEDQKAVTVFAVCPSGSALQFDGLDDFVFVPRNSSLEPSEITVEMWAFLGTEQTANTRLLRKAGHFGKGFLFAADEQNDRRMQFRVDNNGLVRAADTQSHVAYVGSWHHFAGVYTMDHAVFYVDGKEVNRTTHNKGAMNHNPLTDLYIGCGLPSPDKSEFYKGKIDEVRIWNGERTGMQIQTFMHQRLQGTETNLIVYWNFDEGSGQVIHDLSPNANDGQLGSTAETDTSDPLWVASDAPVGICTPYVVAVQNIKSALQKKLKTLEVIDAALENEQKAMDAVVEFLKDKDFGDLKPMDILKAKLEIRLAMQKQINAQNDLRKSIQHLERSLLLLGVDIVPHEWPDTPKLKSYNPADINQDGKVGAADLLLLRQNWLKTE